MSKRLKDTPIDTFPEVARYEAAQEKILEFRAANPQFFTYLESLTEERNDALEAAEKVVRGQAVSCGSFELYQFATKYNPDELYNALGHKKFLECGGKITTQTIYEVDKPRVNAAIATGDIPKEVAERVVTKQPTYHAPKKALLP